MGTITLNSRLVQRSITAASWGISGSAVRIVLQLGAQIVLARILGPAQYGIFAIGVLVVSLGNYLSDTGLAYGLVQRKEISNEDIRFVFTWQVILGAFVAGLIMLSANSLAIMFREPRTQGMLIALSGVCFINALTTPSINLLKRELDHRSLQIGQVIAYTIGYICVGIPLAMNGAGVWALVYAWLTLSVAQCLFLYLRVKHPLLPLVWFSGAVGHLSFGSLVLITNLINWFMTNVDKAIAAHFFPGAKLGLYSTSFTLLNTPTTVLYSTVQSVVFSAAARVQDRPDSISRAYLKLLGLLGGLFFPAFGALAAVSGTLMLALYGNAWVDAAPMVSAFACGMPLLLVWGISTPVLWNTGLASREVLIQLPIAILWVIGAYFVVQHSVVLLAWAMTACFLLRVVVVGIVVCRTLNISFADIIAALRGPALTTAVVVGGVYAIDRILGSVGVPALLVLVLDFLTGVLLEGLIFRQVRAALSSASRDLLCQGILKLPAHTHLLLTSVAEGPK